MDIVLTACISGPAGPEMFAFRWANVGYVQHVSNLQVEMMEFYRERYWDHLCTSM